MKITNFYNKILIIILPFLIFSCEIFKDFRKDYQEPKVRFVDLQGNPRPINLKTPAQNIEALNQQGSLIDRKLESQPPIEVEKKQKIENKYAAQNEMSELESTLTAPTSTNQANDDLKNISAVENEEIVEKIEYDLAKDEVKIEEPKATEKTETKEVKRQKQKNIGAGYFVQVGSFTDKTHAEKHLAKVKKTVPTSTKFTIQDAVVNQQNYHRVLIGPYKTRKSANMMISKLKEKKHKAILIKKK